MVDLEGKKNIIFDLGGVLLNIDYERTSEAFKSLGLNSFDEIYSQKKQSGLFDQFEIGEISKEEFVEEIVEVLPSAKVDDVINAWNAMLLDFPVHRLLFLQKLKGDYRVFLLSNTNQIHEDEFVKIITESYGKNVLFDQFEEVYLSHKIGHRKPDSTCFEYVLQHSKLKAAETIFIDDTIQHIEGAKEVGIDAYFLSQGQEITQLFPDKFR